MSVNLLLRLAPRPFTIAMMASEIPAAMRPYSIAVAPDLSDKKLNNVRFNTASAKVLVVDAFSAFCRGTANYLRASKRGP